MQKVLIICDVYPPSFAPRMGYLVKYMRELNWTADIVTRSQDRDFSFRSLSGDEKVVRVKGVQVPMITMKDKVKRLFRQKHNHLRNGDLISTHILNNLNRKDYNLILCSTAQQTFILYAAWKVAKAWNKPWIADLRDLHEQMPKLPTTSRGMIGNLLEEFQKKHNRFTLKLRNRMLGAANLTTTVSPWHAAQIEKYNTNTHLIYNGYDPDTYSPRQVKDMKLFKITYTGTVHPERHNPELLFQATKSLKENNIITEADFRIQFYVPQNRRKIIKDSPSFSSIEEFVDFYDYIDTSEVPKLLNESAVLLLLSNLFEPDGPKGLISTTKYFEYLAVERPILCVRSDEDLLEASINEANAGVAARTHEETYDFLFKKWKEWKEKGFTTIDINKEYTQQFSRKIQAKQFVDLFNMLLIKDQT